MTALGIFGPRSGHVPLFVELCRFHGLDRKKRLLLRSIMEKLRSDRPAMVFVDPSWLRRAMELEDFAESVEELRELYEQWFGRGGTA